MCLARRKSFFRKMFSTHYQTPESISQEWKMTSVIPNTSLISYLSHFSRLLSHYTEVRLLQRLVFLRRCHGCLFHTKNTGAFAMKQSSVADRIATANHTNSCQRREDNKRKRILQLAFFMLPFHTRIPFIILSVRNCFIKFCTHESVTQYRKASCLCIVRKVFVFLANFYPRCSNFVLLQD